MPRRRSGCFRGPLPRRRTANRPRPSSCDLPPLRAVAAAPRAAGSAVRGRGGHVHPPPAGGPAPGRGRSRCCAPRPRRRPRRHALRRGTCWTACVARMAVVVRSDPARAAALRRALVAAGVPVAVPATRCRCARSPRCARSGSLLRCARDPSSSTGGRRRPAHRPARRRRRVRLRRLRQALRAELSAGGRRPASDAARRGARDPAELARSSGRRGRAAGGRAARGARERSRRPGATAETVLWAVWEAAGLADAVGTALAGGPPARWPTATSTPSSRCSTPRRATSTGCRRPAPAGSSTTWKGRRSPADRDRRRRRAASSCRLVSAQSAAGPEWDAVVVAGVQEGGWPDLRLRGSLLGAQRLADLLDARRAAAVVGAGTAAHGARCSTTSCGCSTSPSPGPGGTCS